MAIGGPYVCRYFRFALVIGLEGGGLGMKQTLPFCPQFLPQIPKVGSSPEELSLSAQMLAGVWRSGVSAVSPTASSPSSCVPLAFAQLLKHTNHSSRLLK